MMSNMTTHTCEIIKTLQNESRPEYPEQRCYPVGRLGIEPEWLILSYFSFEIVLT